MSQFLALEYTGFGGVPYNLIILQECHANQSDSGKLIAKTTECTGLISILLFVNSIVHYLQALLLVHWMSSIWTLPHLLSCYSTCSTFSTPLCNLPQHIWHLHKYSQVGKCIFPAQTANFIFGGWWLCNISNLDQIFKILTKIQHYLLHRTLAYKLYKPFPVLGGLIQAQDGMGEVNQWLCGCVVSILRCPIFRMKQINFGKMVQYTTHQWD